MTVHLHVIQWWPLPGWLAFTIGTHIFAARPLSTHELAHEMTHARQWHTYGAAFIPAYALALVASLRAGTGLYWGNRFEVEARRFADAQQKKPVT